MDKKQNPNTILNKYFTPSEEENLVRYLWVKSYEGKNRTKNKKYNSLLRANEAGKEKNLVVYFRVKS